MAAPVINTTTKQDLIHGTTLEDREHTIPDFLNRLHVLETFSWTTSNTRGTVLKTYRFPDRLNSILSIRNKQANFYGLRAGVELIVQVNSQPFQGGSLMISFLPNARYNDSKRGTHEKDLAGMVSRSGAPRVVLDLMDATRANLCVPYVSPFVFYNLLTNDGNIGDFYISVYAPLRDVAASGSVTVTVAARFTDVELAFPNGMVLPAKTGVEELSRSTAMLAVDPSRQKVLDVKTRAEEIIKRIDDGTFTFQMNTGAFSFKQKAVPNMATSTDSDLTHMLAIDSRNSLKTVQMGNTSKNDMDFMSALAIPCYHSHFTVTTTQTSSTNVFSVNVEPLQNTDIVNVDNSLSVDYIYGYANLFKKWRGGITYKIRVIKTKFHSLRLRISFAPGATAQTGIDRDSCYSEIFDLRDSNTIEFTVPYIHPFPWLNTRSNTLTSVADTSLGLLMVDVYNQMVAPSTVSSTIDCIVERCAAPDFELSVPTSYKTFPFDPAPIQAVQLEPEKLKFQSNELRPIHRTTHVVHESKSFRDVTLFGFSWLFSMLSSFAFSFILGKFSGGWVRDLTCEGIESNPGPIRTERSLISGTNTLAFTSDFAGPQTIKIVVTDVPLADTIHSYDFNVTSNVTSPKLVDISGRAYTGIPFMEVFHWNDPAIPKITITGTTSGSYDISVLVTFSTDSNPVFQMKDLEEIEFQMKDLEQDSERTNRSLNSITQPSVVTSTANYCLGNSTKNVKDLLRRSTYFTRITPLDSRPIHIMSHGIGKSAKNATSTVMADGLDNISYFGHFFGFARGGVNFRLQSIGDPYRLLVNTNNDFNGVSSSQEYDLISQVGDANTTLVDRVRAANLMQHVVNPAVEGIGEFSVPFYSSTYCQGISPGIQYTPTTDIASFTLPDTHLVVQPSGVMSSLVLFRNANADYEFSYLTGPPLMLSF